MVLTRCNEHKSFFLSSVKWWICYTNKKSKKRKSRVEKENIFIIVSRLASREMPFIYHLK